MTNAAIDRFNNAWRLAPDGCWETTAALMPNGYGRLTVNGQRDYAHRHAYRLFVGEIPDGLCIDHLCRNRACCNPAHLEAVSHQENVRRGAKGSLVTECVNGHPYTPQNTYVAGNGTRKCRTCRSAARARSEARPH